MHISKLKKYYFIDDFNLNNLKDLDKNIILIWRKKNIGHDLEKINKLAKFCKKRGIKLLLSNNVKLAIKLKLHGAYISANNKDYRFNNFLLKKNFILVGGAHNLIEVNIKKKQKIREIFISPIFKYKKRYPLGIYKSRYFFLDNSYNKIALGGINNLNLKTLLLSKFLGFAAIEMFQKKRPQK